MAIAQIDQEWASHFPLPPPGNMMEQHEHRERVFVNQGTLMTNALLRCVAKYFPERPLPSLRTLDFGCGVGRVALPLYHNFNKPDFCVDVDPAVISYLQSALPKLHSQTCSFDPPLPFASESFDFVYSISVWTHLSEASSSVWLEEIRRILVPGGIAFLTTSNYAVLKFRRSHKRLGTMGWQDIADSDLKERGFIFIETPSTPGTGIYGMASHDPEWLRKEWAKYIPVIGIESGAILDVQDINVLRKEK